MSTAETTAYYRAAIVGLRYVEHRQPTGRRFGPDADARWSTFRGDLTTADRIDLLIRDADAEWPSAFGARTVFSMRAVAEDEPFGMEWEPLDPVDAEELWKAASSAPVPESRPEALRAAASAWALSMAPLEVGAIGAAEKLLVAGPSAIAAVVEAFASGEALDWADQVTVVATPPAHRQLAALAGGLLNTARPALVLASSASEPLRGRRLVMSDDAHPEDAAKARELAGA